MKSPHIAALSPLTHLPGDRECLIRSQSSAYNTVMRNKNPTRLAVLNIKIELWPENVRKDPFA